MRHRLYCKFEINPVINQDCGYTVCIASSVLDVAHATLKTPIDYDALKTGNMQIWVWSCQDR